MVTPIPFTPRSHESVTSTTQACPYCCDQIPREAKKCRCCGEWIVGTSAGFAAAGLRFLALIWIGVTLFCGAGMWYLGQPVRRWVWMHAVDAQVTPQLIDLGLYTLIAFVVLKGLMVSVGLGVMARLSPRRPRWWR